MKRKDIQEAEDKYFLRNKLLEILATKLYKDALQQVLTNHKQKEKDYGTVKR